MLSAVLKLEHFNKVFDVSDVIFGIIPEQFGGNSRPLSVLFFLYIILTSINTGKFFSKVKLSLVILTTFEFSRQKLDTKILKNGLFKVCQIKNDGFQQFQTC